METKDLIKSLKNIAELSNKYKDQEAFELLESLIQRLEDKELAKGESPSLPVDAVVMWPKIGQEVIVETENEPIGTVLETKKIEDGVELALIDFGLVSRWIRVNALRELDT